MDFFLTSFQDGETDREWRSLDRSKRRNPTRGPRAGVTLQALAEVLARPEATGALVGAETHSVSCQSDGGASWLLVSSKLSGIMSGIFHAQDWIPPSPWVLSLAWSSVLPSPLFFKTLLWQCIESYRAWTWDYSLEGLLFSVLLSLTADPLMPFLLRISRRFILWDLDPSASLQGWLL